MKNTVIEVNLRVLEDNIRSVRVALRPETRPIFVVKANAYGHGMLPVAVAAARAGIDWFGVAHLWEALQLREMLDKARILVLGVIDASDVKQVVETGIVPIIVSEEQGRALAAAARALRKKLTVHLKVDTGMGRLGISWENAAEVCERLLRDGLDVQGLCTHFASVEQKKPSLAPTQIERFAAVDDQIRKKIGRKLFRHVSSSRAVQYHTDWDLDGVRPGIVYYGYGSSERDMRFRTKPVLQWKARVMQVKKVPANFPIGYYSTYTTPAPTTIATIGAGYADGYHRALSNKGFVLINGKRCAVVGRISMNWITADLGPESDAKAGDEAVLIGEQGGEAIWADELARLARTIAYEMLTSINPLIERTYIE